MAKYKLLLESRIYSTKCEKEKASYLDEGCIRVSYSFFIISLKNPLNYVWKDATLHKGLDDLLVIEGTLA